MPTKWPAAEPIDTQFHEKFWSRVDKRGPDECWPWKNKLLSNGYGQFQWARQRTAAHRAAWRVVRGRIPEGMQIDHTCWNRGCVNPNHLRLATSSENMQNWSIPSSRNSSGVRGVCWHVGQKAWMAYSKVNNKNNYLGYFDSIEDAEAAVIAFRQVHHPFSQRDQAADELALEAALSKARERKPAQISHSTGSNNTSGYRGVTWDKARNKWNARVAHNGKRHQLGSFDTAEEAGAAAKAFRDQIHATTSKETP